MYREFRVPADEEIEETLGIAPATGEEVGVRHLRLRSGDGCDVIATTDALGRSVTVRVACDDREILRLVREGATELVLSGSAPEIVLSFRTGDTTGRLELSLTPRLHVEESTLLT